MAANIVDTPSGSTTAGEGAVPDAGRTLKERFDPRDNSLAILRLTLAVVVAMVHAQAVGWGDQPTVGESQVGELAVDGFFVISGFLVTRSALRLPSLRRFVWHRALRILPGFWVCLVVVAFVVAPVLAVLQGRPASSVLSGPDSAGGYVLANAALLIRQWDIAGLNVDTEGSMDGSLWTLFYEGLCYVTVGLLVAAGVLRRSPTSRPSGGRPPVRVLAMLDRLPLRVLAMLDRLLDRFGPARTAIRKARQHAVLLLAIAVGLVHTGHAVGVFRLGSDYLPRFLLVFLLGAVGHVYAHRITFTVPALVVAAATFVIALALLEDYRPLGAPGFAYLLLWAVVALPLRRDLPVDLSYGTYVYHWPVQILLVEVGLTVTGRTIFTLVALAVTAALAYLSWRFVEAPALRQKNAAWIDAVPIGLTRMARPAQ